MPNFTPLNKDEIISNLNEYVLGGHRYQRLQPAERYASFDYCFNYFQDMKDKGKLELLSDAEHIQMSCLQLGFYLASWGMLRGSSLLLQKSVKFFEPLIQFIASAPKELWEIDVNCYSDEKIRLLLECRRNIGRVLEPCGVTDTLATKIMIGIFGNVPAFDSYFKYGFGISTFGKSALCKIRDFYIENQEIIDCNRPKTIDFVTGKPLDRRYTRAKVIDMIFFIRGS